MPNIRINTNCKYFIRNIGNDYCGHPERKNDGFLWFKPNCLLHPFYGKKCGYQEKYPRPEPPPAPPRRK